jgi:hypothetical protein
MAGNILEQAGSVSLDSLPTFEQSDVGAGVVRTRVIDENLKGDLLVLFPWPTRGTVAAVQRFAAENSFGHFPYTIPDPTGGGLTIEAEILEQPDIRWLNGRMASITVRLRRTLLLDD